MVWLLINEIIIVKKLYETDVKAPETVVQIEEQSHDEVMFEEAPEPLPVAELPPGTELGPEEQAQLNQLYANIKHKATAAPGPKKVRFTRGKGDVTFNLDRTRLEPKRSTMVGTGTFEERYLAQLNSCLHSPKEDIDPDDLIPILMLLASFEDGMKTVRISTGKFKFSAGKIVNALNTFFEDNYPVLQAMLKMFNDISSMPQKEEAKSE